MPMKMGDLNVVEWQPREGGGLAKSLCPDVELILVSEKVDMKFSEPGEHVFLVLQGNGRCYLRGGMIAVGAGITFTTNEHLPLTLAPLPSEELILLHVHRAPARPSRVPQGDAAASAGTPEHTNRAFPRPSGPRAPAADEKRAPDPAVVERITPPAASFASRLRAMPAEVVRADPPPVLTIDNVSVGEPTPAEPAEEAVSEPPSARANREEPANPVQPAKRRRRNWYLRD